MSRLSQVWGVIAVAVVGCADGRGPNLPAQGSGGAAPSALSKISAPAELDGDLRQPSPESSPEGPSELAAAGSISPEELAELRAQGILIAPPVPTHQIEPAPSGRRSTVAAGEQDESSSDADQDEATEEEEELELDAFTAVTPGATGVDLGQTAEGALLLQSDGLLRVLETGSSVRERRSFLLDAEALPDGNRFGPLSVSPRGWICLPATSPTQERVAVFPATARSARDVWWIDLSDRAVTWGAGTRDSAGKDVGATRIPLRGTEAALLRDGQLWVASNNQDLGSGHDPGTVSVFRCSPGRRRIDEGQVIRTSGFHPSGLTYRRGPTGARVLVTNSGGWGGEGASLDVIDPKSRERLLSLLLPETEHGRADPTGELVLSPDRGFGYLRSASSARVWVFDLRGLDAPEPSLELLHVLALADDGRRHSLTDLDVDAEGTLYLADAYAGELILVPAEGQSRRFAGFARQGDPARLQGLVERLVLLPRAAELVALAMTVELAPADRPRPGVSFALDLFRPRPTLSD